MLDDLELVLLVVTARNTGVSYQFAKNLFLLMTTTTSNKIHHSALILKSMKPNKKQKNKR